MFATLEPMGRLRSHEVYVLGAIDTALWDIMGKAVGRPVSQLLGQYRTRLKAYASLGYANRDKVAQVVEESVERGFQSIKVRIGVVPGEEKGLLGLAREVAGEKIGLMADVNSGWAPHNAVRNARRLECFDLEWIEEPLRTYHLDEVARIAQAIDTPIALGEHQIFTRYDVRMVLERKAADIIQPDMRAGGISEVKRIADIASAWEVPCIPHFYGNGIRFAAMVQLLGSISNYVYIENDIHVNPLRDELVPDCPRAVGGYVDVPSKPGLGVTVDEAVLAKYTVAHQRV
jgi:L-alanine-DL-glutamate epimerase-like enolase superfamily enzyme